MVRIIQGLISGRGKKVFSSEKHPEYRCSQTSLLVNWIAGVLCALQEQLGCEAVQSPLAGVENMKRWSNASTPHIHLHCMCKDKFTSTWLSVFMTEPLHAPPLNLLLQKGFDNKNVQLNYISHNNTPYDKITWPNRNSNHDHADCNAFNDCSNNLSYEQVTQWLQPKHSQSVSLPSHLQLSVYTNPIVSQIIKYVRTGYLLLCWTHQHILHCRTSDQMHSFSTLQALTGKTDIKKSAYEVCSKSIRTDHSTWRR